MKKVQYILLFAVITVGGLTPLAQAQTGEYGAYYDSNGYYGNNYYTQTQPYSYPYTYPTYPYYPPTYGYTPNISLSQTVLNLVVGQAASVSVYGGSSYSVSSSNPYSVGQTLFGNTLNIQAFNPGSATITVCSGFSQYNYSGSCANLFVYVSSGYQYNPPSYYDDYYPYPHEGSLFDVSTVRLEKGERKRIEINTSSRYNDPYISDNSNRRIASASIDNDELVVKGLKEGTTEITVCQASRCDSVRVVVRD